jgi:thioredoxin
VATIELSKDNFEDVVSKSEMVIIDFWAPWCGPCRSFGPVFDAASEKHTDIVFGKVNADDEQELAAAFNIRSIPYVAVLRQKVVLFAQAGALPAEGLESIIQQVRALDMKKVHEEVAAQQDSAVAGQDTATAK